MDSWTYYPKSLIPREKKKMPLVSRRWPLGSVFHQRCSWRVGPAPRARVGDGLGARGQAANGESDAACAAQAEAIRVLGKRVLIDMTFDRYGHLFPSFDHNLCSL
jgi:hypothetical protein